MCVGLCLCVSCSDSEADRSKGTQTLSILGMEICLSLMMQYRVNDSACVCLHGNVLIYSFIMEEQSVCVWPAVHQWKQHSVHLHLSLILPVWSYCCWICNNWNLIVVSCLIAKIFGGTTNRSPIEIQHDRDLTQLWASPIAHCDSAFHLRWSCKYFTTSSLVLMIHMYNTCKRQEGVGDRILQVNTKQKELHIFTEMWMYNRNK